MFSFFFPLPCPGRAVLQELGTSMACTVTDDILHAQVFVLDYLLGDRVNNGLSLPDWYSLPCCAAIALPS